MTVTIENIEVESNEVIDTIVYLQLMSFLLPNTKSKDIFLCFKRCLIA